ncbi:MAG TPA: neuraminidase-like domain-containing protein [Vicinamibacterales bacterium]|nr:neuraminidase-like domain-containing protein [Vicinamibacterales bacterium]
MPTVHNVRVSLVNADGRPVGGTVDLEFAPTSGRGTPTVVRGLDASHEIDLGRLQPLTPGQYKLTVRSTSGGFRATTQLVTILDTADSQVRVVIDGARPPEPANRQTLLGTLAFDNRLPAASVTVRAYHIGFAGEAVRLGEDVTDAKGAYQISYGSNAPTVNLQVRALDPAGKEVTISATKYNAASAEALNLVVPGSVAAPAPEHARLSGDLKASIGDVSKLAQAEENGNRRDLTLLSQSTKWDARLIALAATAAQQSAVSGVGSDVLYGLYRVGLPSEPARLATIPAPTLKAALRKASDAGIVRLSDRQIDAGVTAVRDFATTTLAATAAPGAVSTYKDLLAPVFQNDTAKQTAFANVFFTHSGSNGELWSKAAAAGIPAATVDALKLQGKLLYLTANNAPLTQMLQQAIGANASPSQIVERDFHKPAAWQTALQGLVGAGGNQALDKLIPASYTGATTADRVAAYAGDLARKVRLSFPTEVTARMVETNELAVNPASAPAVSSFLKKAAPLGYGLGRTPLNRFLKASGSTVPGLDATAAEQVKILHRLWQITPSTESLQVATELGFTSAFDIAQYSEDEFLAKFGDKFPRAEAKLVHRQSRTVSSVTFTAFAAAKALDTSPPVYGSSGSAADRERAKDALVQQFPSMASLFGNLDFCQCDECRSVLSPAAYFVDVLDFLGQHAAPNAAGYTPLDVLIGKDATVPGRRPDLGALPLTCENTNTAMPYIDLVNEIFEYYIAHTKLDAGVAYDTGSVDTADLVAEPQHIVPNVYTTTLQQAVYPLNLPFDLWLETVRGFLGYFKIPFARLLDTFRRANTLALFSGPPATPYFRSQILAESLGISPTEYALFATRDPATWFELYGYGDDTTALAELASAKTLSRRLGITYQELTDLVRTGFLNPKLYPLIFQFERFGISMSTAFRFTNQPGFTALSATQATEFGAQLDAITATYVQQNPGSTFNARTWLQNLLPANYSASVLVLADPDSGCNFTTTTLQYADGTAVTALDLLKVNLFVRLWKKLGWTLDEIDRALQLFFPTNLPASNAAGFPAAWGAAWKTALVYLARLDDLQTRLEPARGRTALLPLWSDLPTQGNDPLYAQLFLTPGVLVNDSALDDPNGAFPWLASDLPAAKRTFAAHASAIEGALGLSAAEVTAILSDAKVAAPAAFTLANLSICYRYSLLAQCFEISVADLIALKALAGRSPFPTLSGTAITTIAQDVIGADTLEFVKQVEAVGTSGFTVEDLQYLLRHAFDPAGKYQVDPNASVALLQSAAAGLAQIRTQHAVPADVMTQPESLIDQRLSGLVPAPILKALFGHLTNAQTYTAAQSGVATAIDPAPFAAERSLVFQYDAVTQIQTVGFTGLLTDAKKAQLQTLNTSSLFAALLTAVQTRARDAFNATINDLLGVWASLAQYEAVATPVAAAAAISDPTGQLSVDAALEFSYDQAGQLQWLGYRGVLTDQKLSALTAINGSATLAGLLANVQQQALPAYTELVGTLLAMWTNAQTYVANATAVAASNQIDAVAFAQALATAQTSNTITSPVPAIRFAYDPAAQVQTLSCDGVLTDALRVQLSALLPSAVLSSLLQAVRTQMEQQFQSLAATLLTIGASDLDTYSAPFLAIDVARRQRVAKAALVKVFLPLLARKLSRELALRTLSASLASDPSLTEALVTNAALLSDPNTPGQSLLSAFLALGRPGVSATYWATPNQSGAAIASGTAATADTRDPTNSVGGMQSCRFEGSLQVPTDGPYRFTATLGNTAAQVAFRIDPVDPTATSPSTALQFTAAANGDTPSQFLRLRGGVLYHFVLDFRSLGANGASLSIQGENLPKGPLDQIPLLPQTAVDGFSRAWTLLAKVLQILQGTGIGERELSYMVAHAAQFGSLKLSALPTRAADDSDQKAAALFTQFLALADYADLRKGPAGGSDGLIDVFQAASQPAPPASAASLLATLVRRDAQTVQDVATALGPEPLFADTTGVRRVWNALQMLQILRLPAASVSAATAILNPAPSSPDAIAANFKNAVKSQYTIEQWRPIAKSVFDALRRRKRDALVAYLVDMLPLESANQLFEYFLIDPGMEPVVQTSRLRLAMSSLQTFVQRCLLNLENGNTANPARNVSPGAIRDDWWDWMKRYRVWHANRQVFLFPENFMEPELRLDKTDLFQALESELLQGDVTRDLVEDAFLAYLKGLEVRARLDIVASYLDQDPVDPGLSTLHVLGRTYGHPHKYFYRTYSSGTWSGWEAVTLDIEGDHIALAMWRGRINVFWLTFITKTEPRTPRGGTGAVASLDFNTLTGDIVTTTPQKLVQVQLHWSERVLGKWSTRISSDVERSELIRVHDDFDPRTVHVHVSKETDAQGNEGAIRIHLDFPDKYEVEYFFSVMALFFMLAFEQNPKKRADLEAAIAALSRANHAFRVTSKNCDPDFRSDYWLRAQTAPYNTTGVDATFYTGKTNLIASFASKIKDDGSSTTEQETILSSAREYALLTCGNPIVPPFLDPSEPLFAAAGGLVAPFFFKDTSHRGAGATAAFRDERTFYVEPSLTETVVEQWDGWAVSPPGSVFIDPDFLEQIEVVAQIPQGPFPPDPGDPVYSLGTFIDPIDWVTNPNTAIKYGDVLVTKGGGLPAPDVKLAPRFTSAATSPHLSTIGGEGLGRHELQVIRASRDRLAVNVPVVLLPNR